MLMTTQCLVSFLLNINEGRRIDNWWSSAATREHLAGGAGWKLGGLVAGCMAEAVGAVRRHAFDCIDELPVPARYY